MFSLVRNAAGRSAPSESLARGDVAQRRVVISRGISLKPLVIREGEDHDRSLDAITAIHKRLPQDMQSIDAAALSLARGEHGSETTLERFRYCNQVLVTHAHGEEIAIFPLLEEVAPWSPRPTRGTIAHWDEAFDAMERAVARVMRWRPPRQRAFKFHLDVHLDKEDSHLLPHRPGARVGPRSGGGRHGWRPRYRRSAGPLSSPGCSSDRP